MNFKRGWDHTYIDENSIMSNRWTPNFQSSTGFLIFLTRSPWPWTPILTWAKVTSRFVWDQVKFCFTSVSFFWHRNKLQFPSKLRWNIYVCYGGVDALYPRFHLIWPLLINSERTEPAYRPVYYGRRQRKWSHANEVNFALWKLVVCALFVLIHL